MRTFAEIAVDAYGRGLRRIEIILLGVNEARGVGDIAT